MKLLLDTHIFLWFIAGDPKLSATARLLIENVTNEKFVSIVSLWEIAIKYSSGKLILTDDFDVLFPAQIYNNDFDLLAVKTLHLSEMTKLPFHHRDPFDRLLAAQAIADRLEIVSVDAAFDSYKIIRHF